MNNQLLARIPRTYLDETKACSACGKEKVIVAETPLGGNRVERLCADCCRAEYAKDGPHAMSGALAAAVVPAAPRRVVHLVEPPKVCVYCRTAAGDLVSDGSKAYCCADATACERRILADRNVEEREAVIAAVLGPITFAANVAFPQDAALGRYVIFGKSGAGKTNTDVVLAEEFLRNLIPTVILDFRGNMWGLRSSADGLQPGFAIPILGGRFADLPLHATDGALLAGILGHGFSAILDLSLLSQEDQQDFCAEFLEALDRCAVVPMHVIIEEAERVAPARSTSSSHFRASVAAGGFARQCRNGSVGWTFSTQRVGHITHDVLNAASAFVAMQNSDEDEQKAIFGQIASRVGKAKAKIILATLATLKRGEAWLLTDAAWLGDDECEESAPLRFRFRMRTTYDSARPKRIGEQRVPPSVRAEVDLEPFRCLRPVTKPAPVGEGVPARVEPLAEPRVPEPTLVDSRDHSVPGSQRNLSGKGRPWRKGRSIMLELLRRSPQVWTPRPILLALTGLDPAAFSDSLQVLIDDGMAQTRRGRGGGVSLTVAGYEYLGVRSLSKPVLESLGVLRDPR